jgi:hypothetical protein
MKTLMILTGIMLFLLSACQSPTSAVTATQVIPTALPTNTLEPTATPTLEPTVVVNPTIENRHEEGTSADPIYTYSVNYPWVNEALFPDYAAFNQEIQQVATDSITQFLLDVQQFQGVTPLSTGSLMELNYEVTYNEGQILSIVFTYDYYIQGAAHNFNITVTKTYLASNGQFLQLSELFNEGSPYLDTISANCITDLTQRNMLEWPGGASPTAENYQRWNITPDGLMITFDEYSIGPYAMGIQRVTVPYAALQDIIDPNGALKAFLAGQ